MFRRSLPVVALAALIPLLAQAQSSAPATQPNAAARPAAAAAPAPEPPIRVRNGILVEKQLGRGVYTYTGDTRPGFSDCDSRCTALWPPLRVNAGDQPKGPFTIAIRPDGSKQWAWRGQPLYRWVSDRRRGDAKGDNAAGVWHLVKLNDAERAQVLPYNARER
jgi:predicted lipoprotein with Yx(FWY)xxD motif